MIGVSARVRFIFVAGSPLRTIRRRISLADRTNSGCRAPRPVVYDHRKRADTMGNPAVALLPHTVIDLGAGFRSGQRAACLPYEIGVVDHAGAGVSNLLVSKSILVRVSAGEPAERNAGSKTDMPRY